MFYLDSKKLFVAEATTNCGCCGECGECGGCEPSVSLRELTTFSDVATELRSADMRSLVNDLLKNSAAFQSALKDAGWANYESLKTQKDKVSFTERFFLAEGLTKATYSYLRRVSEVDLSNLSDYDAKKLASTDDAGIFQKVSITSLKKLSPKAYKAYLVEKKRKKAASKRSKKAAETRKRKKKERELAKARKLLEEAGEA